MNNALYSRPIPQWKGADSLDTPPPPFTAVELEGGYLLPQRLTGNEIPVGCAVRTSADLDRPGAHGAPYPALPLTFIAL